MKIQKGDKVKIISGKDKGKEGSVIRVYKDRNLVLVEGINKVKKHIKKSAHNQEGGIVSFEKPVHVSNVMFIDSKSGNPTRLGYTRVDGKKHRIAKKTGDTVSK